MTWNVGGGDGKPTCADAEVQAYAESVGGKSNALDFNNHWLDNENEEIVAAYRADLPSWCPDIEDAESADIDTILETCFGDAEDPGTVEYVFGCMGASTLAA